MDTSNVAFTLSATGGISMIEPGAGLFQAENVLTGGPMKFAVIDDSIKLEVIATEAQATQSGMNLSFTYTGATTGVHNYLVCTMESGGEVMGIGKLISLDSSAKADGQLAIPAGAAPSGTYKLNIYTVQDNGAYFTDFCSQPVSMSVNVTDGVATVSNFKGTKISGEKAISSFTLAGASGVVDDAEGTIAVTVPFGTTLTGLTPVIAHTGTGISPTTAQNFANPVTYTVTAQDGSTKRYIVTVTVAAQTAYAVNVINGTADPETATPGTTVSIAAQGHLSGIRFVNWTSADGVIFADASNPITTFVMPPKEVTVTANFEQVPGSVTISDTPARYIWKAAGNNTPVQLSANVQIGPPIPGKNVTWSVDKANIASIDEDGLLTFMGVEGTVRVTAIAIVDPSVSAYKDIMVVKNVTKIDAPLKSVYIQKGKSLSIPYAIYDSGKEIKAGIIWKSSNANIATVTQSGKISIPKTVKKGKSIITATPEYGPKLTVTVNVSDKAVKLKSAKVTTPISLKAGNSKKISITLGQKNATGLAITFKSSGKGLTVDKAGLLTANKKGKYTVSVKIGSLTVKKTVIVS